MRPRLAEKLVRQAAVAVLPVGMLFQVHFLDEVFAVEEADDGQPAAGLEDVAALAGELLVAHLARHLLGGAQRAQVQ